MKVDQLHIFFVGIAMLAHIGVCARMDWKLAKSWLIAALRAVVQLSLLGFFLLFLFQKNSMEWNALAGLVMLGASAWTAVSRATVRYPGLLWDCALSFSIPLLGMMGVIGIVFWRVDFLSQSSWILPLLGILMGNALSGISLGLNQWLREIRNHFQQIEFWFSLGATREEALRDLKKTALNTAMTSVLNSMAVSGLVSIPGMMSGQLIAGGDPQEAVLYQLLVLFLISCIVFLSTLLIFKLTLTRVMNAFYALKLDVLEQR